jgi:hypothetical protein
MSGRLVLLHLRLALLGRFVALPRLGHRAQAFDLSYEGLDRISIRVVVIGKLITHALY